MVLRIFLADDHPVVREGLKALVNVEPDMEVVGYVCDGEAVLTLAPPSSPDIIMMDMSMPKMTGVQATEKLQQVYPAAKVIILSVHEDSGYVRESLRVGASGYILKRTAPANLIHAIRAVAAGGVYIDPALAGIVVGSLIQEQTSPTKADLSERETEVVRLVAYGHTNKEIASKLAISVKTVETYKARAMDKLDVQGRAALVRYAVERGWL